MLLKIESYDRTDKQNKYGKDVFKDREEAVYTSFRNGA